jgi:hypothetical protein
MDTSHSEEVLHWPAIWHCLTTEPCTLAARHQTGRGIEAAQWRACSQRMLHQGRLGGPQPLF